jgi:hypothetical protein
LITTNSLSQTFARRVVQAQLSARPPLSLLFAIPDHPWVDTAEGAAVRIAMTVGAAGDHTGELLEVTGEEPQPDGSEKISFRSQHGKISADLTTGADVTATVELKANENLTSRGMMLFGDGFIVTPEESTKLGLGKVRGLENIIHRYRNGRDLADKPRGAFVIDLFGLTPDAVRDQYPEVYQHVFTRVKPERDANRDKTIRENWWIFGRPRTEIRPALVGLSRYIATVETSKHRLFQFLESDILPDNKLVVIALEDAFHLGILSSRIHVVYSLAAGSWLGVGNDPVYAKSRCFDPFPFPLCDETEKKPIRKLAEQLDAHRKRVQAQHSLRLTGLYNVLEKIRAGEKLNDKEKLIHDAGLVSVLKQLHDDLDAAVSAAYGWPATLTDADILERLVALNAERAAEEKRGVIHWLRPAYQAKGQAEMVLPEREGKPAEKPKSKAKEPARASKSKWPTKMAERVQLVETALHHFGAPATPGDLAKRFKRAQPAAVAEILETLATLGRARKQGGKFTR